MDLPVRFLPKTRRALIDELADDVRLLLHTRDEEIFALRVKLLDALNERQALRDKPHLSRKEARRSSLAKEAIDTLPKGLDDKVRDQEDALSILAALCFGSPDTLPRHLEMDFEAVRTVLDSRRSSSRQDAGNPKRSLAGPRGGRPAHKMNETASHMRAELTAGRLTEIDLVEMKELALAERYRVSRGTARSARDLVLGKALTETATNSAIEFLPSRQQRS